MSLQYKQRWEIVFLCLHPFGPKMTQVGASKYLKISRGSVRMWINRYKETGAVDDIPRSGRSRVTTEKQDLDMVRMIDDNKALTSQEIANNLAKKGVRISSRTVRRRLNEKGLHYGNTTKKPLLKQVHVEKRLQWATENVDRDWSNVIFTDEATFRFHSRINRIWKRRGEIKVVRTVKHSTKVNLYGCFSARGFGKLIIFKGNLNASKMVKIYKNGLLPSARTMFGEDTSNWILQEDNDPKHKSRLATAWKEENGIQVMKWPAQSPDCNPIENVWGLLKNKLSKKRYKSIQTFIKHIRKEWNELSREYAAKLVESCDKRCVAVIQNKGDWTIY